MLTVSRFLSMWVALLRPLLSPRTCVLVVAVSLVVCTPDAQATSPLPGADPKEPDWVVEYGYFGGFPTQLFVVPGGDVIAVGDQDSVSSTYGDEAALIKRLSPAGTVVWSLRFNGVNTNAAAMDPAGFLYVAGVRGYDYSSPPGDIGTAVLIKIDLAGNLVWERLMPGADGYTVFKAVSIDLSGRAVVSATERMGVSDWRCVVRQYADNGDVNWTRVIQKAALTYNEDLDVDAAGNVYVTVEAGGFPHWLLKFTANNDSLWAVTDTTASGMRVVGDRVYLSGDQGTLSCYTTNGVRLWTLPGVALLEAGADYFLVREGGLVQLRSLDGTPFWSVDTGLEIRGGVLVPERGVFITGYFNCCGNRAAVTAKLTLGGVPVWAQTPYQSPGGDSNYGSGVSVDASSAEYSYIYVIGKAHSPHAGITVTKLSEATVSALVARFTAEVVSEGIRLRWRFGSAIVGHGTIERADRASGPWTMPTMETQLEGGEYSAVDGTVEAGRTYHYRLVVDEDGQAVTLAEVSVMAGSLHGQAALLGVSPAPSEGRTAIDFVLSREEFASLKVFDIHGRTEAELVNEVLPAGRHRAAWSGENARGRSPAGVYFVRLEAEGRTFTRRIVIAR